MFEDRGLRLRRLALRMRLGVVLMTPAYCFSSSLPSFNYETALKHEIKPHRRSIPAEGVRSGFNQLQLTLTVSEAGDVVRAEANGSPESLLHWPQLRPDVLRWKFVPFEVDGAPVLASVEEYVDLVPPERLPQVHVATPEVKPTSKVQITLSRTMCYGSCPAYSVSLSSAGDVVFNGSAFVAKCGTQSAHIEPGEVLDLARKFVAADFFSMDNRYNAMVTDMPGYTLSLVVDGQKKEVHDYMGPWAGMPEVIRELEDDVDIVGGTERWVGNGRQRNHCKPESP